MHPNRSHATVRRAFALSLLICLCIPAMPAWAASTQVCLRNTGDAMIHVAVLYRGSWGGWVSHGWWHVEPEKNIWSSCTPVPDGGTSSPFFYIAVRQKGADGQWGSIGFDVSSVQWEEEDNLYTRGATFKLVPRSTLESGQGTSVWGLEQDVAGANVVLCVPKTGTKKVPALTPQSACSGKDIRVLFGTKLYTPTDGGMLEDNLYEIYFRSDATSRVFQLEPTDRKEPEQAPPPGSFFSNEGQDRFKKQKSKDQQNNDLLKMLEAEADKGNVAVQKRLAQAYMSGELGVKNAEKAARCYLRAASSGDVEAHYEYAVLVLDGHVEASKVVATTILRIAANKGSQKAAEKLKTMAR